MDDLISGGPTSEKAKEIKSVSQSVFAKGTFELHKWHRIGISRFRTSLDRERNVRKRAVKRPQKTRSYPAWFAMGKKNDTVGVSFPQEKADPSKRGILSKVARIYDPLGLASPISLGGKLLYRDVCDAKLNWDAKLPSKLFQSWIR